MQRYKALEDLGVKQEECYLNWLDNVESKDRDEIWSKEREEYGIDERETWNWSDDFIDYMYIHLEMFNRINCVAFDREFEEIDGEQRSVQSIIDEILDWLRTRYYPKKSETISIENYQGTEEERQRFLKDLNEWYDEKQHILDLFAKIISHLNW